MDGKQIGQERLLSQIIMLRDRLKLAIRDGRGEVKTAPVLFLLNKFIEEANGATRS